MSKVKKPKLDKQIALNKKTRHDYFVEKTYEGGLVLEGWEVKSLRAKRAQLKESYIKILHGEIYLFGAHISPLDTVSTHIIPDPMRTRKLLLHNYEIAKLIGAVERKGYALVPLSLYWLRGKVKLEFGLAKGKKLYDKRAAIKEREWNISKERILMSH